MTAKQGSVKQEPFLNTVARKLGHAAGTFTNVAQELTENLSTLPEAVSTKMRQATTIGTAAGDNTRHPRKKSRRAARTQRAKSSAGAGKRTPARNKSARRRKSTPGKKK